MVHSRCLSRNWSRKPLSMRIPGSIRYSLDIHRPSFVWWLATDTWYPKDIQWMYIRPLCFLGYVLEMTEEEIGKSDALIKCVKSRNEKFTTTFKVVVEFWNVEFACRFTMVSAIHMVREIRDELPPHPLRPAAAGKMKYISVADGALLEPGPVRH